MHVDKLVAIFLCLVILGGCRVNKVNDRMGSFTLGDAYSYDKKYVAKQSIDKSEISQVRYVEISIIDTKSGEETYSFVADRAMDFWGICWENNSYNIWTQSGDTGLTCYKYDNGVWRADETIERPESIVSKYD